MHNVEERSDMYILQISNIMHEGVNIRSEFGNIL